MFSPAIGALSTIDGMHDSMKRLLDVARAATNDEPVKTRVQTFADLSARMGVSSAVMTNWKARGLSKEGALKAANAFKCSANYLLDGADVRGGPLTAAVLEKLGTVDPIERGKLENTLRLHLGMDLLPTPAKQTPSQKPPAPAETALERALRFADQVDAEIASGKVPPTRRRRSSGETTS